MVGAWVSDLPSIFLKGTQRLITRFTFLSPSVSKSLSATQQVYSSHHCVQLHRDTPESVFFGQDDRFLCFLHHFRVLKASLTSYNAFLIFLEMEFWGTQSIVAPHSQFLLPRVAACFVRLQVNPLCAWLLWWVRGLSYLPWKPITDPVPWPLLPIFRPRDDFMYVTFSADTGSFFTSLIKSFFILSLTLASLVSHFWAWIRSLPCGWPFYYTNRQLHSKRLLPPQNLQ